MQKVRLLRNFGMKLHFKLILLSYNSLLAIYVKGRFNKYLLKELSLILKIWGVIMLYKSALVFTVLIGSFLLSACSEKPAEPAPEVAPAAEPAAEAAPATEPAPAPEPVAGGYEPTDEERVPGITRTKEEQDKINAELLAGIPLPIVPGEAPTPAAEPAPETK